MIRLYQAGLAPLIPGVCRFQPGCSAYAAEAVRVHGALMGSWLAARRVLRCHPLGGKGYDPVPAPRPERAAAKGGRGACNH